MRNTKITKSGNETTVTFYNTDIVSFDIETITLDSGGHRTASTKKRLNETSVRFNLGYKVYTEKGYWLVEYDNSVSTFKDGMILPRI